MGQRNDLNNNKLIAIWLTQNQLYPFYVKHKQNKNSNLKPEIITYITKAVYNFMLFTGMYFKYKDSARVKF